jgi:glycosyltransferase involved in cell wall biosynthesis
MTRPRATVVVPLFNEARSLPELSERVQPVLDAEGLDWEVLFVDDGSSDDSYEEIEKLHAMDPRFKCLRFARNFGSHVAISAGLEHARGDVAIVMTADLEEPPEAIPDFLRMWREGYHVIWGIRATRANRGLARFASLAYHRIFAWLAEQGPGQSEIGGGFFLADAKALEAVREFSERNRSIIGLLLWAGFKHGRVTYQPAQRRFGTSKWSFKKKIRFAIDTFVQFSSRPLRLMLTTGSVCVLAAFALLGVAVVLAVQAGALSTASAASAIAGAVLLVVGVQLAASGLLGEYLSRTLEESRRRPLYVVMDRLGVAPKGRPGGAPR